MDAYRALTTTTCGSRTDVNMIIFSSQNLVSYVSDSDTPVEPACERYILLLFAVSVGIGDQAYRHYECPLVETSCAASDLLEVNILSVEV